MEKVKEIIDKYKKLSASHIPIQEVAEIITLLQQSQFKVATEDSCVVLEKPEGYQDWLDSGRCLNKKNDDTWLDRCMEYDKAPSISKPELELNKMRVENDAVIKELTWFTHHYSIGVQWQDITMPYKNKLVKLLSKLNKD